jgi:tetratricopeptide (TPR) repeat protein
MSLLLDALARASSEKEKLAGTAAAPSPTPPPAPPKEPAFTSPAERTPFPDLAAEAILEPVVPATPKVSDEPLEFDTSFLDARKEPEIRLEVQEPPPAPLEVPPLDFPAHAEIIEPAPVEPVASLAMVPAEDPTPEPVPAALIADPPAPIEMAKLSAELADADEKHTTPNETPVAAVPISESVQRPPDKGTEKPAKAPERPLSPQIAREILQATSKPSRKLPSRRVILLGVVALIGVGANALFFFGFLDKLLGIQNSVYIPPVAIEQPPVDPAPTTTPVENTPTEPPVATAVLPPPSTPVAEASNGKRNVGKPGAVARSVAVTAASDEVAPIQRTDSPRVSTRVFTPKPIGTSALDSAYSLLTQDRIEEAAAHYQQALTKNAGEIDALLGLSYIARRQGQRDEARSYYQRILRQQPNHPAASAGLLEINNEGELQGTASRARELAERNPESAVALSTLGGMLAREGRIAEAQQAYFKALSLEPANAFHAYNLAVALDRMHKYAQAQQYYERSLSLFKASPASGKTGFPLVAAEQRLAQLRGADDGRDDTR